ncbi:MAG: hypothetical protein GEU81_17850 [Nitriliruptorales bacterium]|nr:hypothetical protein [Nitriliruptorales bacterium]
MTFHSLNAIDGADGERRHQEAGKPIIPSLLIDGQPNSFQHPAQIAALLGLEEQRTQPSTAVAWDIHDLAARWLDVIRDVPFEAMLVPTPSRGRDLRNLTVNVFRPIGYLPDAWRLAEFNWYTGEADLQQEALLRDRAAVVRFAEGIAVSYSSFLAEEGDRLVEHDPDLRSNRGEMTFSTLLVAQRFHAAFHYRQMLDHFAREGVAHKDPLPEALVKAIGLPANLY